MIYMELQSPDACCDAAPATHNFSSTGKEMNHGKQDNVQNCKYTSKFNS